MPARPLVAMIALKDNHLPSESQIIEFLAHCRRELPPIGRVKSAEGRIEVSIGNGTATISLEPAPLPWSDLEPACEAAWYWPEAAAALRDHVAHAPVVLLPADDDRAGAAVVLTCLVAAVAACSHAAGVYWAASGLVQPPEAFISYSEEVNEEYLPLNLWIDFRLTENEDGTRSLSTSGLEEFGLMELEVHHSRLESEPLVECAFKMAHYVLENGPIVEDGETVELSEEERVMVRFGPSQWDASAEVMKLEI